MHFALPPRKTSHPPPYANRSSRMSPIRKRQLQLVAGIGSAVLFILYLISHMFSGPSAPQAPANTPRVIIVTALDSGRLGNELMTKIMENRKTYAAKHGYQTFFPGVTDYDLSFSPTTWSRVPAVRHAMSLYPWSTYIWYLDQYSLIMNPSLSVEDHIMSRSRLESLMITDHPVVPPDSVIKTFSHLRGDHVDLVLTQDKEGLSQASFIVRAGDWAKYFLDSWFDPLYRNYNFQKAEAHALEHIVQWHPTILAKLGLVPQRMMNSYAPNVVGREDPGAYKEEDFVIHFKGCDSDPARSCATEMDFYYKDWQKRARDW